MKVLLVLLAFMMFVAPTAMAIGADMDDKPKTKTILAGPGAKLPSTSSRTIGALKQLATKTRIKGFGLRTELGKGVSVRAGLRRRQTGKAQPNILGGRRGLSPRRGTGPALEFKIRF
jgi:hypothetical protein